MDVLTAIKGHLENEVPTWAKELVMEALSTYTAPAVSDVPTLSWIAQVMGAKPIFEMVEQKVPDTGTYEFLIALARSLHDLRSVLSIEDSIAAGQQEAELARTIHHCISAAIPQWEVGVEIPQQVRSFHGIFDIPVYYNGVGPNPKVDRIIDLVELCFKIDDLAPLTTLLENLLQIPAKTTVHDRFRVLYKPLVPRLKTTLTALGQSMALEPFKSFFKNVISLYLARILGVVPAFPPPTLPNTNIGCGCSHCEQITPWLSRSTAKLTFQAVQQTRTHIEGQITKARISHLARMSTDATGRPYTLVVNKVPELEAALVWRDAQKLAEEFIESVADTDATKVIMQDRYQDATDALSGVKVFILGDMRVARRGDIIPGEGILPLVPGAAGATVPVAGVKRKQPS
ncbi:hypothetical protein DFP72DRAFT_284201 [Ephemerocybe angulata]|uniref:Uncharacterized protein n=1 Tax=Ephemerocybe angulata TaxID=980116 RepID=A0A8H6I0A5_9AGAR|nr:hypothetical protein DFP72DRAFT_284201 [Tulosesus angulatus]